MKRRGRRRREKTFSNEEERKNVFRKLWNDAVVIVGACIYKERDVTSE